ncbi:MAG: ATP-binding cassette domain-containing protein, partial [Planctomycetota bacterium]|nr:ATP-binding cassette domain-containing protein [Planctomycetota bacterium]
CGKTTIGRALLGLVRPGGGVHLGGSVTYDGQELIGMPDRERAAYRRRMQIIFQDPYSSLNPRMTVGTMIAEPMILHSLYATKRERLDRTVVLLEEVGLGGEHVNRYPHEFSGGQRQRISVARALAVSPDFIVCDESVSALDVSVQAQVLNLLCDLQAKHGLTYIFISHDLSVVKFMSDTMAVMNAGRIVEYGPSDAIYANPAEAYTRRLIEAVPSDDIEKLRARNARRQAQLGDA